MPEDAHALTVLAGENAPGIPTQCSTTTVVTVASQGEQAVRLLASVYEVADPDPPLTCPDGPANGPTSHRIDLGVPFDDRAVVGARTGEALPVAK